MEPLDRRSFLGAAAVGLCGLRRAQGGARSSSSPRGFPQPCSPDAWKKGPVILGQEGGPGDRWVQNFTCPAEPLEDGRWRLWYSLAGPKVPFNVAVAEGVPGEPMNRTVAVLSAGEPQDAPLAIGNLPEAGGRSSPSTRPPRGSAPALLLAHGPGVIRYLAAESDDGRRYPSPRPAPALPLPPLRPSGGWRAAAEAGLTRFARKASPLPGTSPPPPPA